jgi:hypothetical protein
VEGNHIKTFLYHNNYCITTLFHETMPTKYVWSANGTRVLSEDYQETCYSPEQVNQVKAALIELLLNQPNGAKILSPEDKQALLNKAFLSTNKLG